MTLPVTYEGDFELRTSNVVPTIQRLNPLERDPAGNGRTRTFETKTVTKGRAAGDVYWDRQNMHRSRAILKTSNSPASLRI